MYSFSVSEMGGPDSELSCGQCPILTRSSNIGVVSLCAAGILNYFILGFSCKDGKEYQELMYKSPPLGITLPGTASCHREASQYTKIRLSELKGLGFKN